MPADRRDKTGPDVPLAVSDGELVPLAPELLAEQGTSDGHRADAPGRLPWRKSAELLLYICAWYAISISMTLYNKWLFSVYDFHFPLLVTALHVGLKMPAARLIMSAFGMAPLDLSSVAAKRNLILRIAPTGFTMAGDIALSNLSLLYISVTYYTIVKSSVPLWILGFSILMKLQKPKLELLLTVFCVGLGIALASTPAGGAAEAGGGSELGAAGTAGASGAGFDAMTAVGGATLPPGAGRSLRTLRDARTSLRTALALGAPSLEPRGTAGRRPSRLLGPRQASPPKPTPTARSPPPPPGGGNAKSAEAAAAEASAGEEALLFGCVLVLASSMCSGFRWTWTQLLLTHPHPSAAPAATNPGAGGAMPPVVLLYYISPFGLLALLPVALALEFTPLRAYLGGASASHVGFLAGLAGVGGLVSCLMLVTEMQVVKLSSGLTLSVSGIFKELLTVLASALVLGDTLTWHNVSGLLICLVGIAHYTFVKRREMREADASGAPAAEAPAAEVGDAALSPPRRAA